MVTSGLPALSEGVYFFFVSPYPGFGTRSTKCVLGCSRAFFTVVRCPVLASRPRGEVLIRAITYLTHQGECSIFGV
jgi:hypothetical protein